MSALHPTPKPPLPAIDAHVVAEGMRAEIVDGQLLLTPPAEEPHGTKHLQLAYLLGAHVAAGYLGAVDMLMRAAHDQDFAPDASVFPEARDPDTGKRQVDAMSFEILGEQAMAVCTSKARALIARGVRRVFCIHLANDEVLEWYPPTDSWARLDRTARITDVCLASPLPIAALLDATEADDAVVDALRVRDSKALRELQQTSFRQGRDRGREEEQRRQHTKARGRLLRLLSLKFGTLPPEHIDIIRTADEATLERIEEQMVLATTLADAMR